jgi:Ras-related protein Rab-22
MESPPKIKIVFYGDSEVGKSSLIKSYNTGYFDINYYSYSSSEFITKNINYNDKKYALHIWDTNGREGYRPMCKIFVKDADIIVLVYDITRKKTFLGLQSWLDLILENKGNEVFLILVGNKNDLYENEEVREEDGKKFAEILHAKFILTSAKDINSWKKEFEGAVFDYIKNWKR